MVFTWVKKKLDVIPGRNDKRSLSDTFRLPWSLYESEIIFIILLNKFTDDSTGRKGMNQMIAANDDKIRQWLENNTKPDSVRSELLSQGFDNEMAEAYVKAYMKFKNAKRQRAGFILLASGAVIGFISCVLTILNPFPSLYEIILYGLTSLSVLIIFAGLYLVFE